MMRKTYAVVQPALTKGTRVMNAHKFNMYAGAVIGSLLVFLLLSFFSELIYVGRGHSEHETLAFAIEAEEAEVTGGDAEAAVDWAALVQGADTANGEKIFGKCKACHKLEEGKNGVGPTLWGVVGRDIASTADYSYSDALTGIDGNWGLEHLSNFIESPKSYAPGTKMSFSGLKKIEDRVNLIAYLNEADGTPIELATQASETEAASVSSAAETVVTVVEAATEAATEAAPETVTEPVVAATEGTEEAAAAAGGSFADLLVAANIDLEAGEKKFRKCKACHSLDEGKNGVGPSLWGIVNRDVASIEGFKYSDAMMAREGTWTGAKLFEYLENPRGVLPGTKMTFRGLKDAQDRINVIGFLNEVDGSPELLD
jgi:cytochrome c